MLSIPSRGHKHLFSSPSTTASIVSKVYLATWCDYWHTHPYRSALCKMNWKNILIFFKSINANNSKFVWSTKLVPPQVRHLTSHSCTDLPHFVLVQTMPNLALKKGSFCPLKYVYTYFQVHSPHTHTLNTGTIVLPSCLKFTGIKWRFVRKVTANEMPFYKTDTQQKLWCSLRPQ